MPVPNSRLPAWTQVEFDKLLDLLTDAALPDEAQQHANIWQRLLASGKPPSLETYWGSIRQDPLYIRLQRDTGFREIQAQFRKFECRCAPGGEFYPRAEFAYLRAILVVAHVYLIRKRRQGSETHGSRRLTRSGGGGSSKPTREKAISAARKLRGTRAFGVKLEDATDDAMLWQLIEKLMCELQGTRRKHPGRTNEGFAIYALATTLSQAFYASSPKVLELFAKWLNIDFDRSNIARLSSKALKDWRASDAYKFLTE